MKFLHLLLGSLLPCLLMAQPIRLSVPFQAGNGDVYDFALAGGLNNPQFSAIDLDGDGDKDLVFFDRQGFVVVPFLNGGAANTVDYSFAPEWAYRFPKLENWMLLRDYNCDLLEDIFARKYDYNTGKVSITVYEGSRDAQNKVQFTNVKNSIEYHLKNQSTLYNLFNSSIDLPAVDDIDGDGDMDILNFNNSGGYIEMFKNESQENGFGCDSLIYVLNDNCWGRIYESGLSEFINLSPVIDSCPNYINWTPIKAGRHSGSTLTTLDRNNDGVKELLLGDLAFANLNLLTNGGTLDTAHLTSQEMFFPQNSTSVNIDIFPAAFYVDVNNDGAKDLLAAPNIAGNAVDSKNWYYKNTGTANFPIFTFQQNDFIVSEMIDLGTGAAPAFVDYNGDGLLDIVVGNDQLFINAATQECFLSLYKNIGTATQPSYQLVDPDFANMKQYNQRRFVPTFGDLDNDGDQDMMLGLENGQLIYVPNLGTATLPNFSGVFANYASIDVGQNSAPQLVDVDRDGDLDLIIGEQNGNTNYFENTGTATTPLFSSSATTQTFGFIDTKLPGYLAGNSAPHLVDVGGVYHLFMGNEVGEMWHYTNIDGNILGAFTRVNGVLDSIDEGKESILAIADINGDAALDFLLGNERGGLGLYTESALSPMAQIPSLNNSLTIAPNPSSSSIEISFSNVINAEISIQIINLLGQVMYSKTCWINQRMELDLLDLPMGTYFLTVATNKERYVEKLIKNL